MALVFGCSGREKCPVGDGVALHCCIPSSWVGSRGFDSEDIARETIPRDIQSSLFHKAAIQLVLRFMPREFSLRN